jgi:hypothetical protein
VSGLAVSDEHMARAYVARKRNRYKDNPCAIVKDGMFKITTTVTTRDGQFVEAEGDEAIVPLIPTENQKKIIWWFEHCQKQRIPVAIHALKKRREGLSTLFQALAMSRALTINGYRCLTIAHQPTNTEEIFAIGRRMRRHLPWYFAIPDTLKRDSTQYMEVIAGLFGVTESSLQNLPATERIGAAHGTGFHFVHCTEVSRFEDPERYKEATASVLMKGPWSARVNETTSNGVNEKLFYPEFMASWREQGGANWWEPGYKANKAQSLAIFFPAYTNQTCSTVQLPPDVSQEKLMADFDDYEKWLYRQCERVWIEERNSSYAHARQKALEHVFWRRCKLPSIFTGRDGLRLVNPGSDTYPSEDIFKRMEPNTVDEAFESSYVEKPLSPDMCAWLNETVKYPDTRGEFLPSGEFLEKPSHELDRRGQGGIVPIRLGWSIWGDLEKTSGDLWASVDFCEGQVHTPDGYINWARDFTHAHVFDYQTGEHVAEYISQKLHSEAAKDIWHFLCLCQRKVPGSLFPYMIWEAPHGKSLQQLLLRNNYPWERIYFRIKDEGTVEQTTEAMGIYPTPPVKTQRVQLGTQAIMSRRFINRSDIVARQSEWFIRRGRNYEAIEKDGHGEKARDDGLVAYLQIGYVDTWLQQDGLYQSPAEPVVEDVDGSGEYDPLLEHARSDGVAAWMKNHRAGLLAEAENQEIEAFPL